MHIQSVLKRRISRDLPVFRLDKVGEGLGFLETMMVVVAVVIVLGSDIFHLVDTAAFGASLHRSLTRHLPKTMEVSYESPSW